MDENCTIDAIFPDWSKAFDGVEHQTLLKTLKNTGFPPEFVWLKSSYLMGREQSVIVEGAFADFLLLNSGLPQGALLGPLMFIFLSNALIRGRVLKSYQKILRVFQTVLSQTIFPLREKVRSFEVQPTSNQRCHNDLCSEWGTHTIWRQGQVSRPSCRPKTSVKIFPWKFG